MTTNAIANFEILCGAVQLKFSEVLLRVIGKKIDLPQHTGNQAAVETVGINKDMTIVFWNALFIIQIDYLQKLRITYS